ncbi:MAG: hypothetical protein J6P28_03700 [Treponema sp.]|nr:hypothetical protein [Treponema sp.]
MNDLMIFENKKFGKVRTVEINNEPWFVGKDVAEALGFANPQKAIRDHVEEEDKKVNDSFTLGQGSSPVLINESGLYSLIFGSKLDSAKEFKHWVTSEILPSLRKTGSYTLTMPQVSKDELSVMAEQSKVAKANIYLELSKKYGGNKEYAQILDAYATKSLEGKFILPLPKLEEKNYSATEVGEKLGISSKMVGKIANRLGIKVDGKYGKWYIDKSPYSNKEVNTFRYSDEAVRTIEKELA